MTCADFFGPEMRAALAGGGLGVIAVVGGIWLTARFNERDKDEKYFLKAKAWLNGLWAELGHIKKTVAEIQSVNLDKRTASTKRLNSDFIERSRLDLFEYDEDALFLEVLTNTYRDIVHTNGMLDRLEEWQTETRKEDKSEFKSSPDYFRKSLRNTKDSFTGVGGSIDKLEIYIRIKIKQADAYERLYLRNKSWWRFWRWFPPTWQEYIGN